MRDLHEPVAVCGGAWLCFAQAFAETPTARCDAIGEIREGAATVRSVGRLAARPCMMRAPSRKGRGHSQAKKERTKRKWNKEIIIEIEEKLRVDPQHQEQLHENLQIQEEIREDMFIEEEKEN